MIKNRQLGRALGKKMGSGGFLVLSLVILLAVIACMAGCGYAAAGKNLIPKPEDDILESFDESLAASSNRLGIRVFNELLADEENIFISPISIATALAMTYNGAGGETKEALAGVLAIEDVELKRLNENNWALLYLLQEADTDVQLYIANSLWMRDAIEFNPEFIKRNEKYYNASTRTLDFNSPKAADTINKWVYEYTGQHIKEIVETPIHPFTILFLINAVYFKGDWSVPFDEQLTIEDTFHFSDGATETMPFMSRSDEFEYYEEEDFQAVRLPYGDSERIGMYLFLPAENSSVRDFYNRFDHEQWGRWKNRFMKKKGDIRLPRLEICYEKTLNDVLKMLGMEVAFDEERADFNDMLLGEDHSNVFISKVKHKSYIEVNEKGTEAAAATSVEMRMESAALSSFYMNINRPFFFLIHDHETDVILFMGAVEKP